MPRYHFDEFVLSPRRRLLLRGNREIPLIPRYFDLLVFLVERRHEAVHRRDIFENVWRDANVSDSALSQAIRTLRVVLDDDSKEPRFIRTVSRHGYRFVFADVREHEEDDGAPAPGITANIPAKNRPAIAAKCAGAAMGGGLAGLIAGAVGGAILAIVPGSTASFALVPVLALIGASCGVAGGAGVGAGVSLAESAPAKREMPEVIQLFLLILGGAAGGGLVGTAAEFLGRWSLAALVSVRVDIGGGIEGLIIGGAAGLGYGLATRRNHVVALTAAFCGLAALMLAIAGRPLVGGTIHAIATGSGGSQAALTQLGRLIGEPGFGPVSRAIIGTGEAVIFGLGLALGLTNRSTRP